MEAYLYLYANYNNQNDNIYGKMEILLKLGCFK